MISVPGIAEEAHLNATNKYDGYQPILVLVHPIRTSSTSKTRSAFRGISGGAPCFPYASSQARKREREGEKEENRTYQLM